MRMVVKQNACSHPGGTLSIKSLKNHANVSAIVEAFYPGMRGAEAMVGLLFGDYSPAGRMPTTTYDADFVSTRRLVR